MRFTHNDIVKIIYEINEILNEKKSLYNIVVDFRYDNISISSKEVKDYTKQNLLLDYSSRDEAHRWLEGFITSTINQIK